MTRLYEVYAADCVNCGYPETRDHGPYDPDPVFDQHVGGALCPAIHLMSCPSCGSQFDVVPEALMVFETTNALSEFWNGGTAS